jgi:hypothetical protein
MNLNIECYSKQDLIKLFSLKPNFDSKCVQAGKDKLSRQLLKATDIDSDKKLEIQFFIDTATTMLIGFIDNDCDDMSASNGKMSSFVEGKLAGTRDAPPGWLNPINVRTTTTAINIDSRFRTTGTSSDFQVNLPVVQKNIVRTTITNIDLPSSFYGVMRERGDATFVITEYQERSSSSMKDVSSNTLPIVSESSDLNYDNQTGQWSHSFAQRVLKLHPCFSHLANADIPDIESLVNESEPGNPLAYKTSDPTNWESAGFFKNPLFSFGWLIVLPDGNYECEWQEASNSADLVYSMNVALSDAVPGILFHSTGTFLTYRFETISNAYGIDPSNDLVYNVDRISGKSSLSIPNETESVFNTGRHIISDLNYPLNSETGQWSGFCLKLAVNNGGGISLLENIQLRLGWQLGFREASYMHYENNALVSEGVAMIMSPRYLYLSIDDGLKSGSDYVATVAQSVLRKDVMAKLNISQPMGSVGVYKSFGETNQSRDYFGSGTITRLKVKLTDEHGRILSLNNMDWSMTMVFTKLYE